MAANEGRLVDQEIGTHCLEQLSELAAWMPDEIYSLNPIALYERMSSEDSFAYCPFAYTYSNYSRKEFGAKHIRFSNPVALEEHLPIRTVLGGTGIALSKKCGQIALALEYSLFVAGRSCQSTLYGICGGQPASRSAWHDSQLNQLTDHFFTRTAASIEAAYVRPRYAGYVHLQERAGEVVAEYCRRRGNAHDVLERIDTLYRISLKEGTQHV